MCAVRARRSCMHACVSVGCQQHARSRCPRRTRPLYRTYGSSCHALSCDAGVTITIENAFAGRYYNVLDAVVYLQHCTADMVVCSMHPPATHTYTFVFVVLCVRAT